MQLAAAAHDAALLSLSLGVAAGNGSHEGPSLAIDDILDQLIDEIAEDLVTARDS